MGVTIAQSCASEDGRESGNMRLLCIPRRPSSVRLRRTRKYWKVLERVEVFKSLGRLIAYDDADTQAMRSNLRKACGCWAQVSHVLRAENTTARTCEMFYKATVQAILFFRNNRRWNHSREENARHVQETGRPSRVLLLVRHPPSRVHGILHRRFDGRPHPGAFRIALHLHRRHRGHRRPPDSSLPLAALCRPCKRSS